MWARSDLSTECLLPTCHHCGVVCGRKWETASKYGRSLWHCSPEHLHFTLDNARPGSCEDCHAEPARVGGLCGWCWSERQAELDDERAVRRWGW